MADADDVRDQAATLAAAGISSASSDGQQTTALDPEKLLNVADRLANRSAVSSNRTGILFTKLQPPGAP